MLVQLNAPTAYLPRVASMRISFALTIGIDILPFWYVCVMRSAEAERVVDPLYSALMGNLQL
jgi:hypothetical protein